MDQIDYLPKVVVFEITTTSPEINTNQFSLNLKEKTQQRHPTKHTEAHYCQGCENKNYPSVSLYSVQCKSINKVIVTEYFSNAEVKAEVNCGQLT